MKTRLLSPILYLALVILLSSPLVHAAEHPAMVLVKETTDTIMTKIKEQDEAINKDQEVLHDLVNTIVLPHFDFRKMSSWVLGKNWRKANKEQKQKFTDQFSRLLVRTYSKALHDNSDKKIEFLPIRGKAKKDEVVIRTEIPQKGGFPIPIDYKMHLKKGEWKVYDQEIKKSGIDNLIAKLADRNKEPVGDKSAKK